MKNQITVYTTSTCPYCVLLKNFLNEQDLPFKEINLEKDAAAAEKLINTTGQLGVPQAEVNGHWVLGFDQKRILEFIQE
ncbi:glutaredoxin family protein [Chengkuizengella axinellae]|uniref:Glutaredoxin family protein n=1 Tax=Chengkuizengella axinellae TaxID=3064388 RepID=A0ABT9J6Q1_9BACL|nr:glutaredoxin family protein [Chengkuizengella sp. 2205SS18-9]MDP5276675.1 glutaredoxin family protein [Chengkuizengella sp. 2205SS18-9]